MNIALKLFGGLPLVAATFLFIVFTASINAAQNMGGPMNMSPSLEEWFYIVLALDALFLIVTLGGIWLLGLTSRAVGMLCILVGTALLALGVSKPR